MTTLPAGAATAPARRRGLRLRPSPDLLPPAVALFVAWTVLAIRSGQGFTALFGPGTWSRWDTAHYFQIAQGGYTAVWHCGGHSIPPHLPPGNYLCGTVQWFPGYPLLMRGLTAVTGMPLTASALVLSWGMWYLALWFAWKLLAGAASPVTRWVCLGLVAFAPGAIYFAAEFPISTTVAGMLGCVYFGYRSPARWAPAGAFVSGLVAGCGYISAVALPIAMGISLLVIRRSRLPAVLAGAAGGLCGFGGVLLGQQVSVGIWDGYFVAASKYSSGQHDPLTLFWLRVRPLWENGLAKQGLQRAIGLQSVYTAALLLLAVAAFLVGALRRRRIGGAGAAGAGGALSWLRARVDAADVALLAAAIGGWLIAYSAGVRVSVWRSEAFVVLAVPLLRRIRPGWLLLVPLVVAADVAWTTAGYFFDGSLV